MTYIHICSTLKFQNRKRSLLFKNWLSAGQLRSRCEEKVITTEILHDPADNGSRHATCRKALFGKKKMWRKPLQCCLGWWPTGTQSLEKYPTYPCYSQINFSQFSLAWCFLSFDSKNSIIKRAAKAFYPTVQSIGNASTLQNILELETPRASYAESNGSYGYTTEKIFLPDLNRQ